MRSRGEVEPIVQELDNPHQTVGVEVHILQETTA